MALYHDYDLFLMFFLLVSDLFAPVTPTGLKEQE
jgi:hypothetical protein